MLDQKDREPKYVEFNCPHCSKKLKVPKGYEGTKGKCPECGKIVDVPNE